MPQIVLRGVSKAYGPEMVLSQVDLSLTDGATTALVGPSGAGKSTLLQLINGLVRPGAGTVEVFGRPIDYARLPELRLRIGYAVQGNGLFPHLRAGDNMTLLARLAGWPRDRIRARASELMELVGLPASYSQRYPHELSGGQQQRVGLCRAMMLDPPMLLLDEPFASLDAPSRREIHAEFLRLQAWAPRTVVLVTHDASEAMRLAQRVVILRQGGIVQHATVAEVAGQPANDFVRELFQTTACEDLK